MPGKGQGLSATIKEDRLCAGRSAISAEKDALVVNRW